MKISSQDEYGLRILLRIARADAEKGLSIPQLSELEGLSEPYVAKLTRALRLGVLIQSTRAHKGRYYLVCGLKKYTKNRAVMVLVGK